MPHPTETTRRSLAFHAYAALCALTGLSGLALSVWLHPMDYSAPLVVAAQQNAPAAPAAPLADARLIPAADTFRGMSVDTPGSL